MTLFYHGCKKNMKKSEKIREDTGLMRSYKKMTKILFVCHGSILKSPGKASKINGFTKEKGAYYTTTTPFLKEL